MTTNMNMGEILIKALGLEKASKEKQDSVIQNLGAVIYQAVITRAMEEMNDETISKFEKVTNGEPNPDMLIEFFMENIPNFEQMMKEESDKIIKDAIDMSNKLNK